MSRPELTTELSSEEFKQYYFLKEELKGFLRSEGLKVSGSKADLEKRIVYYLDTGKSPEEEKQYADKNASSNVRPFNSEDFDENSSADKSDSSQITLDSKIGSNFKCSEDKRQFFINEIGKGFKFKVAFQKWLKANPDKTYGDAIEAYYNIQNSKEKTRIVWQFKYNQYIRDFFENNDDKSLDDAIKCWNYKKSLKGNFKYEDSDLEILK